MNKKLSILTICFFITCCFTYGYHLNASALIAGDIIGEATSTNILAHINNYPINSYNIDGYTYVRAEDLENYGFNVNWNADERKLSLSQNKDKEIVGMNAGDILIPKISVVPGEKVFDLYYTDIIALLNGNEIKSFNIDGSTVISMEDLASCGELKWLEWSRNLRLTMPVTPKEDDSLIQEVDENIKKVAVDYLRDEKYRQYAVSNVSVLNLRYLNDFQVEVKTDTTIAKPNFSKYSDYLLLEKKDGQWSVSECMYKSPSDWNKFTLKKIIANYYKNLNINVDYIYVTFIDYISPNEFVATLGVTAVDDSKRYTKRFHLEFNENGYLNVKSEQTLNSLILIYDNGLSYKLVTEDRKFVLQITQISSYDLSVETYISEYHHTIHEMLKDPNENWKYVFIESWNSRKVPRETYWNEFPQNKELDPR